MSDQLLQERLCPSLTVKDIGAFEHFIQQIKNLFIIQAEVAGADKTISKEKVQDLEEIINRIEKELPKIDSFFVSGSCESSALFDHARSVSRRAEREVVKIKESAGEYTLAYLNRLSSILYALARLSAHKNDITESAPTYE